jgi:hypothetical protein
MAKSDHEDTINPHHYTRWVIQPIEFIEANDIGYSPGNVIKYVCRWEYKDGVRDLYKARNYIDLMIERAEKEAEEDDRIDSVLSAVKAARAIKARPSSHLPHTMLEDLPDAVSDRVEALKTTRAPSPVNGIHGSKQCPGCGMLLQKFVRKCPGCRYSYRYNFTFK